MTNVPAITSLTPRHPRRGLAVAATTVTVATAVVLAVMNLAYVAAGDPGSYAFTLMFVALVADLGIVGGVLAMRRPDNRVGWLLLTAGLLAAITFGGGNYGWIDQSLGPGRLPFVAPIAWVTSWTADPMIGLLLVFLPLIYPSGRLPGSRWRIVGWMAIGGTGINIAADATRPGPLQNADWLANPVVLPEPVEGWVQLAGQLGLLVAVPVFAIVVLGLAQRFRRSSGIERQQLKWFLFVASVAAIAFATSNLATGSLSDAGFIVGLLAIAFLPLAIAIAILRYRLYEIDRIVSRTLGWTVLTLLLVVVFVGINLLLDDVLASITQSSTLAVAAATLIVFALFQPLRRRVQELVDRRFDRRRYEAQRIATEFATRLRDQLDVDLVRGELAGVLGSTVAPASIGLWIRGETHGPQEQT